MQVWAGFRFGFGLGLGWWPSPGEAHRRREDEVGQPSTMRGNHLPRASRDGEGAEGIYGWRGLEKSAEAWTRAQRGAEGCRGVQRGAEGVQRGGEG